MKKIKIVITGVTGRMGMQIAKRVLKDKSLVLYGATERSGHKAIGKDLGQLLKTKKLKIKVTDNIIPLFAKTDAVIDFTTPEATLIHTKYAAQARIVHVIGTTGFNSSQLKKIKFAAQHATIIKSGNMSLGINLINLDPLPVRATPLTIPPINGVLFFNAPLNSLAPLTLLANCADLPNMVGAIAPPVRDVA